MRVLEGAADKPDGLMAAIDALLAEPTRERIDEFRELCILHGDWEPPPAGWPTQFLVDSEPQLDRRGGARRRSLMAWSTPGFLPACGVPWKWERSGSPSLSLDRSGLFRWTRFHSLGDLVANLA
jgi:hypothetical protein